MNRGEFKDYKNIMKVLSQTKIKDDSLPSLDNIENKVLEKIEVRKLKKEIKTLKRLEFGLLIGIFVLFIFFFPRGIENRLTYFQHMERDGALVQDIENVIEDIQNNIESYLDSEYELNPFTLEEDVFYDETY